MNRTMMICLTLAVLGAGERAFAQFVPRPITVGPVVPIGPIGGLPGHSGMGQNFGLPNTIGPLGGSLGGVLPTVEPVQVDFGTGPGSARSDSSPTQAGSYAPSNHDFQHDASHPQPETRARSVPAASNRETTDENAVDASRTVSISAGGEEPEEEDDDDDDDEGTNWWLWLVVALTIVIIGSKLKS